MKFNKLIEMIGANYNNNKVGNNPINTGNTGNIGNTKNNQVIPDSDAVLKIKKELAIQQEKEAKEAAEIAKNKAVDAQNKQNKLNTNLGK